MTGYEYRAVFTNSFGTASSAAATLTVTVAPVVTFNPVSKTVAAGLPAAFTASASGTPAPTVQWQSSTNGTTWTNIAGATATTYTVTAASAITGTQYRAMFTNSAGTVATTAATLTVNTPPVVTTNPVSQVVNAGTQVTFTAAATDAATPTVQWQVSASGGTWTNIFGATSTSYSITTTAAMAGNQYRAVFTDSSGLTAATTAAMLTVISAPAVTANPSAQTVTPGTTASFTAAASGTPAPTVQWQVSTDGSTWNNISGATATTYSLSATITANGYQYRAVFTNSQGTATTSAAKLTVTTVPLVITSPTSQAVVAGTTVSFTAAATGATNTQWQSSTNGGSTWINIVGATSPTYSVTAAAAMSGYQYRVYYTNASGSVATTAATLTVGLPITITSNPQSAATAANSSVTFTTSAIGTPAPTVQWQVSTDTR